MIKVMFCGNDRIFDGLLSCMISIFNRREVKENINFYVCTMDLTDLDPSFKPINDTQIEYLNSFVKEYGNNKVIKIDCTDTYNRLLRGNMNEVNYCSPYTLLRLCADEIKELKGKILYLDVDILFNRDIKLLYDIDVEGFDYAGVLDEWGKFIDPFYFNAGVLLLNLEYIKNSGFLYRCRELTKKRKLIMADQSAINFTKAHKKKINSQFNSQNNLRNKKSVIRHFCKRLVAFPYPHFVNIKQWNISSLHKELHYYSDDELLFEFIYRKEKFEREILKLDKTNLCKNDVKHGKY